jgi:hypothetical protein
MFYNPPRDPESWELWGVDGVFFPSPSWSMRRMPCPGSPRWAVRDRASILRLALFLFDIRRLGFRAQLPNDHAWKFTIDLFLLAWQKVSLPKPVSIGGL